MLILALDASSPRGSLALCRDGGLLGEREWTSDGRGRQQLFSELEALLRHAGGTLAAIDLFVVGRGPGNFSGLRASLAAFQALALPGDKPVRPVSSGRALASAAFERDASLPGVHIVGDARRGMFWHAACARPEPGAFTPAVAWTLSTAENFPRCDSGFPVISPEPDRLTALMPQLGARLALDPQFPLARHLAAIALMEISAGEKPEPFLPLYMQPAVLQSAKCGALP